MLFEVTVFNNLAPPPPTSLHWLNSVKFLLNLVTPLY